MRIHLQDIERSLPEAVFLLAEDLVTAGRFQKLTQLEKSIWTAQVTDLGEVELELNGNFFKVATCDCGRHQARVLCEHVVGLLLVVRDEKNRQRKAIVPKEVKKTPPAPIRFSSTAVIEEIEEDELRKFVKEWARHNRPFELAIKAKFANQLQSISGIDKYSMLLDETRRGNRRTGKAFNIQGQRNYLRIIKELITQGENSLNQLDFKECAAVILPIIKELQANIAFVVKSKHPILQPLNAAFAVAKKLVDFTLAPELNQQIFDQLISLIAIPSNSFKYILSPTLELLFNWQYSEDHAHLLLEKIGGLQKEIASANPQYQHLISAQIIILAGLGKNPFDEVKNIPEEPEVLTKLINLLIERKEYPIAINIIEHSFKLELDKATRDEIEELWLTCAQGMDKPALIASIAEKRLLHSYDISYLDVLKKTKQKWEAYLPEIFLRMEALPESIQKKNLLANFFRKSEKPDALFAYIEQTESLALLGQHAKWLYSFFPEKLGLLYPQLLKTYAEEHIGPKATEKINYNLSIVAELFGKKLSKELHDFLLEEYKHTSLLKI